MSDSASIEEALERRTQEWRELADERAKAKGHMVELEHFRKVKLALLATEAPDGSEAFKERWARAHPEYEEVVNGYAKAVEDYERADRELFIALKKADLWQTIQANKRAERQQYNG